MQMQELKNTVNRVFREHGQSEVLDFGQEFADGCRITDFYNHLFDDDEVVGIKQSALVPQRKTNWKKVNSK